MEFCAAVAEGDIGRVFEIIKVGILLVSEFSSCADDFLDSSVRVLGRRLHQLRQRASRDGGNFSHRISAPAMHRDHE